MIYIQRPASLPFFSLFYGRLGSSVIPFDTTCQCRSDDVYAFLFTLVDGFYFPSYDIFDLSRGFCIVVGRNANGNTRTRKLGYDRLDRGEMEAVVEDDAGVERLQVDEIILDLFTYQ